MKFKNFVLTSLALSCSMLTSIPDSYAVKAWDGVIEGKMENGERVLYRLTGDEFAHSIISLDGTPLEHSEFGLKRVDSVDRQSLFSAPREADRILKRTINPDFPTTGKLRGLVVLAEFADNNFCEGHDATLFHARMNEQGYSADGATGSARDYFIDQSFGLFTPDFDVVGPVKLSEKMFYYGQNQPGGQDMRPAEMISEACRLAKSDFGTDFTKYDFNEDGTVDFVYVIYAGYAESYGAPSYTIWPHAAELSLLGQSCEIDGKKIDRYACSSELKFTSGNTLEGIGTFCHEFGHVLGLPDLYDIYDLGNVQLGVWDIMDQGSYNNDSNTPPAYSAYERATLGWLELMELNSPSERVELPELTRNNVAYIINSPAKREFFVLENRQQKGWDAYLPATGMMITHVDFDSSFWTSNMVNCGTHSRVDLIEADNRQGFGSFEGDLFPYGNNDMFTDYSLPSSLTWDGEMTGKGITEIRDEEGTITFRFMMDRLATPADLRATGVGDNWIDLSWEAAENAETYCLNVKEIPADSDNPVLFEEDFNQLKQGEYPNADFNDISMDLDSFTGKSGWKGTELYQAGGWIQLGRYGTSGSLLSPPLGFTDSDDSYTFALKVNSYPGKSVDFTVSLIDSATNEIFYEHTGKANKNEKDILLHFTGLPENFCIKIITANERLFIDRIRLVNGDVTTEDIWDVGEREWSVPEIMETHYSLTDLLPRHTYCISVEASAHGEWHKSLKSEEIVVNTDDDSAISEVEGDKKPLSVRYYDITGRSIGSPSNEFHLVVKTYSDGSIDVRKVLPRR